MRKVVARLLMSRYADTATGTTFALTKNLLAQDFDTAEEVGGIVTKAVARG